MDIHLAKEYIIQDIFHDIIYRTKSLDKASELIKQNNDLCPFAVFDTTRGSELYEIGKSYYGEYIVYQKKFMHLESFLKFNNDNNIIIL